MKINRLSVAVTLVLSAASTVSSASEPLALSKQQMDLIAAGSQQSTSVATAMAQLGLATTSSQSTALTAYGIAYTSSTSVGLAAGIGASAQAAALTMRW